MQGYKYKGCYKDQKARTLAHRSGGASTTATACAKKAAAANAKYMGLQWWEGDKNKNTGECWWGDKFLRDYGKASNCIKNSLNHYVAGAWSNAIYEKTAPEPTPATTLKKPPITSPLPSATKLSIKPSSKIDTESESEWGNIALIGGFGLIGIVLLIIVILIIIKIMNK